MPQFSYTILPPGIPKPWLGVHLGYKKSHKVLPVSVMALIDSGADVSFCARSIGDWLGVTFRGKQKVTFTAANNQTFEASPETVTLTVGSKSYECPFYFSEDLPPQTPIILGQRGFFDHFVVTFDLRNRVFSVD